MFSHAQAAGGSQEAPAAATICPGRAGSHNPSPTPSHKGRADSTLLAALPTTGGHTMETSQAIGDIINKALLIMGDSEIDDFGSPTDGRIQPMHRFYHEEKAKLLSLKNWPFATRLQCLGEPEEATGDIFPYAYAVPEDCLRILGITSDGQTPVPYEYREHSIYAATSPAWARYIYDMPDDCMPVPFRDLLANSMAAEACYKITGDKVLAERLHDRVWGPPSANMKGGLFGYISSMYARQNPAKTIASRPFAGARWQGIK